MGKNSTRYLILGLLVLGIVVGYQLLPQPTNSRHGGLPNDLNQSFGTALEKVTQEGKNLATIAREANEPDAVDSAFKQDMLERFGHNIDNPHTQVKAIEKLLAYLKAHYPDSWRAELKRYLEELFSDHADAMFALLEGMEQYNNWMQSERASLAGLSPEERRQLIWEMRYNFFGEVANEIWASSLKSEALMQELTTIAHNDDLNFAEQAISYKNALSKAYGEQTESMLHNRMQELNDRFLSLPKVQQRLTAMPKAQRYDALNDFRRGMGMDDDAVERWHTLDQVRDQRREQGERYMAERSRLTDLDAPDTDQMLADLRKDYFGEEAEVIANEEASGYFRFSRPQVIGRD